MIIAVNIVDESSLNNEGESWVPVKGDKSDAVLATHFIRISILRLVHQQKDGALQFVRVSGCTHSEGYKKKARSWLYSKKFGWKIFVLPVNFLESKLGQGQIIIFKNIESGMSIDCWAQLCKFINEV